MGRLIGKGYKQRSYGIYGAIVNGRVRGGDRYYQFQDPARIRTWDLFRVF